MRVVCRRLWKCEAQLDTFVPLSRSHPGDSELTIYIKGFLAQCEGPGDFSAFHNSHGRLETEQKWGPRAYGYSWEKGKLGVAVPLAKLELPIPVATVSHVLWALWTQGRILRIASPAAAVALVGAELTFSMMQILRQYYVCRASLDEQAKLLAEKLRRLVSVYIKVRMVAHSLGCLLLIKALRELEPREQEVLECHLLAPAVLVEDCVLVVPNLKSCCVYYTSSDWTLAGLFSVLHLGEPIGSAGAKGLCRDLDVSSLTRGVFVHREFPKLLPEMIALANKQFDKKS
jgi:hypothetical protein